MFEHEGVLRTWSTTYWPGRRGVMARRLTDHRLDYLDYEGPVSGGRGIVRRIWRGRFVPLASNSVHHLLHLSVEERGKRMERGLRLWLESIDRATTSPLWQLRLELPRIASNRGSATVHRIR